MDTSQLPTSSSENYSEIQPKNLRRNQLFLKLGGALFFLIFLSITMYFLRQQQGPYTVRNTAKNFQLVESSPEDQDGSFSVVGQPTFVFSKPIGIAEKDLGNYFQITPRVAGTWHLEKNGQVVYFSSNSSQPNQLSQTLAYNTIYIVTINKYLPSVDNHVLSKNLQIAFRTKQNPLFAIESDKKLIATAPNEQVTINLITPLGIQTDNKIYDVSSLKATIATASDAQLLTYFQYKEGTFPLYQFIPTGSEIKKQIPVIIQPNQLQNSYEITLPKDTFPNSGIYFVTIANNNGHEDFFVTVSQHISQVFNDGKNTYTWASEQNTGNSISGVTAALYAVKNTPILLHKAVTGSDGIAKSPLSSDMVDFVITHKNNDVAVTFTKNYANAGYASSTQDKYQVFSYSDRPVYRPGDVVHYKAVIRKKDNGNYIIPQGTYYIQLLLDYDVPDPNTTYKAVTVDENGTVAFDTTLPAMTAGLYPQITLSIKNADGTYRQIDALPLVIQSYRKPDMDITATTVEKEYISGDNAHVTVAAKTNYGQPLTNVSFSYRILVNDFQEIKDRTTEDIPGAVTGWYGLGDEFATGNGRFDSKGLAHLTFSTKLLDKYELSQIAMIEITPNIGASPSIGKLAKLIHRGEFAVFIDRLTGDTKNGISGTISVLNHMVPRQPIGNKTVVVSLYKVIDNTNKQLLQTQTVTSAADGTASFSFQNQPAGSYEVTAQAVDARSNTVTARESVYVGEQLTPSSLQDTLDMQTQKSSYTATETATVSLTASFPIHDAIVVLTNDNGNSSHIISLTKATIGNAVGTIPIQLQDSYGQNVGIDIFTVNNGNVVRGHTDLNISTTQKKIHTSISFDKQVYKPGDSVSAVIHTTDDNGRPIAADNSLSVIDASLLQIGQLNGAIFDSFYGFTPYSAVNHYDSTAGILTQIGGGGGGCFLEGTKILMHDGTSKNIESVHIGDHILTRASDASSRLVVDTVVNTYRHAVTDYLTINNTLQVTWIHRIYINNAWHEAKDAKIGDTLLDEQGNFVKITSITRHQGQFVVYNLTTSHYHTFFANGFYVHNDKGPGPRSNFVDTVYWNPHVQTNTNGVATISFTLPDNLTTFTAQAVSNTKDAQFGQTTANFVSQKDFNIIPVVSNFYYQGDKPVVSALVQNSSQHDIDTTVSLTIQELGTSKNQTVHIQKGDFGTATFPIDISSPINAVSFLFTAKDTSGNTLDSLVLKKPILPKGNIMSSWESFQGSKTRSFTATYPSLDFNNVTVSVVPNIVDQLFHSAPYFTYDPSIAAGQDMYAYSYILAKTRDGEISPTSYTYAKIKNAFRDVVDSLLQKRSGNHWVLPPYSNGDTEGAMNLWIAQGLTQASQLHMLDDITNIASITESTKNFEKPFGHDLPDYKINLNPLQTVVNAPNFYTHDDQVARQWIIGEKIQDDTYTKTPESLAINILEGDSLALGALRSQSLTTANDRYIWEGKTQYAQILPVLAMVQKGSVEDANKAIKGLSYTLLDATQYPLALLAGVQYAERNHYYMDEPGITVSVNDTPMYKSQQVQQNWSFTQSILPKNTKNGTTDINIATTGDVPVYTTIVRTDYNNQSKTENTPTSLFDQIQQTLGLGTPTGITQGRYVDVQLKRVYKDTQTGKTIPEITQGKAGIVVLLGNNQFTKYLSTNQYRLNSTYAFMLEDAISPAFMYLPQTNNYSNSPQYQSVLSKIFPGSNTYYGSTTPPSDYSDEAVIFNDSLAQSNISLPYIVYNVSGGSYYQPKTSIVFPILGLLSNEK